MTEQKRGTETAFGMVSLVMGMVSLLMFCSCINWVTGIIAIVFGSIQVVKNEEKGFAVAGMVMAVLSMLLSVILFTCILMGIEDTGRSYEEFYRDYLYDYDAYDSYDDYDDPDRYPDWYDDYGDDDYDDYYDYYYDDYYDYYDDLYGEGGQEFL